jgi:hypothetical protein
LAVEGLVQAAAPAGLWVVAILDALPFLDYADIGLLDVHSR